MVSRVVCCDFRCSLCVIIEDEEEAATVENQINLCPLSEGALDELRLLEKSRER